MRKHTPGPWKVTRGRRGPLGMSHDDMAPIIFIQTDFHASGKIKNGSEATICEMKTGEQAVGIGGRAPFSHRISDDEVKANTRLIAASPDLLDALQALGQYTAALEMMLGISEEGAPLASARAAITKVKPVD